MKILELILSFIVFCFKCFITVCLVFSGPVGWVLLYLWDRDVKARRNANIRTM